MTEITDHHCIVISILHCANPYDPNSIPGIGYLGFYYLICVAVDNTSSHHHFGASYGCPNYKLISHLVVKVFSQVFCIQITPLPLTAFKLTFIWYLVVYSPTRNDLPDMRPQMCTLRRFAHGCFDRILDAWKMNEYCSMFINGISRLVVPTLRLPRYWPNWN